MDGATALHWAAHWNDLEMADLLIRASANVRAANRDGATTMLDRGAKLDAEDKGEDFGFGASSSWMTPLNWAEGVPIGMSSAIYQKETVALLTRLMTQRGIPIVSRTFRGRKSDDYVFGGKPDASK